MIPGTVQATQKESKGCAYCPICTHTVPALVVPAGKKRVVKPGQKCPRCSSALEAASVIQYDLAA